MTASPQRRIRASRASEVQDAIKDIILERKLVAGDAMPTEYDLMGELGVSRNSVREALKALQAVGIVEIRHGFGMFVGRMTLTGLVDELAFHGRINLHTGRNLGNLIEIREVLESGLVERLIDDYADAELSEVADVVARMEREAARGPVPPETDRRFHEVLYGPMNNPLIGQLLGAFWDVYFQLQGSLGTPDETPEDVTRRHRDIYLAVVQRDKAAARAAMTAHFDGVRSRLARLEAQA